MTLDINQQNQTIMGVKFDTPTEFEGVWYALSSNIIEGYEPSVEDVEKLKDYMVSRRGAVSRA